MAEIFLATRQEIVQSKSVGELAQLNSFSDFPLPENIEKMIQGKTSLKMPTLERFVIIINYKKFKRMGCFTN